MARSSTPKLEKSISLPDSGSKRLTSRRQVAVIRRSLAAAVKEQEEEAVNAILAEIGEALNCRTGVLRVIDKLPNEANTLRAYATYNFDLSDWKKKSAYLDLDIRSPMTQAFLDQKVIEFSDIQQENPRLHMNWAWIERYDLHSAIYLPVGSSRGVLSLYRSEIKPFSKGEIIFCEELADVLALAIDKSNAEQRYRKLREMSDALSNLTELDDILREACIHIRPLLGVELGSIFLKTRQIEGDEDREYLIRAELSAEDIPDNWFPNERYKIGQGVIGRALNERNDIVVENNVSQSTKVVRATVRQYNRILKTGRCVHVAAAPLIGHDGSQLGVIRVMNKLDNHSGVIRRGFAESDIEILRTLTSVIADAIDDAQLRDKLRNIGQSTKIISLQNDQSTKTLEENFRELLINIQQVARHLKLADEVGAVAILPDHHRLTGIVDFANEAPYHTRIRPGGVTDTVIETGEPLRFQDIEQQLPALGSHHEMIAHQGIKSYAVLPLRSHALGTGEAKSVGAIAFYSREKNMYTDTQMGVLTLFANQVAIPLASLWAQSTVSGEVFYKRYEFMLDELHDRLGTFEKQIIHQAGLVEILLGYGKVNEAKVAVGDLAQDAERVYRALRALLEQDITTLARDGLVAAIDQAIDQNRKRFKSNRPIIITKKLNVSRQLPFALAYDTYWIVSNTLANSMKSVSQHAEQQGRITVKVNAYPHEIHVRIQNNGPGFDPDKVRLGYGITRMREIAYRRQAEFKITSHEGSNKTTVEFFWRGDK